jgi:hypothetical protein
MSSLPILAIVSLQPHLGQKATYHESVSHPKVVLEKRRCSHDEMR